MKLPLDPPPSGRSLPIQQPALHVQALCLQQGGGLEFGALGVWGFRGLGV